MWFSYVDESYDATFHWVGALLVEHEAINPAQRALLRVVEEASDDYGIGDDAELHGHEIFQGTGAFAPMHEMHRARIGVFEAALRVLAQADAKVILRGVQKPNLESRYSGYWHPHRVTMTHLIERIDEFAEEQNDHALVVADEHHEMQSDLLRDLRTFQLSSTWGYRSRKIRRVVDTIHFVQSRTNPLTQGADLVTYLARRMKSRRERDARAQKANEDLWSIISPSVVHEWCWWP